MPNQAKTFCTSCRKSVPTNPDCNRTGCPKVRGKFRNKRDEAKTTWYNLPIWKGNPNKPLGQRSGLREAQLKAQPLCEHCLEAEKIEAATIVDHKRPWKTGADENEQWQLFSNPDNLQSLCVSCHNIKTARENKR
jgi:5-methylcytosine-specific restriction protein A